MARSAKRRKNDTVVAVTGAAGYVGGWIVRCCLERGYSVRACVRDARETKKVAFLKDMFQTGRLTLHSADMTCAGVYDSIFLGCHAVFHVAEAFMSWVEYADPVHVVAMKSNQHVIDSINRCSSVCRLVYTSTICAMMDGDPAFYEECPIIDESRHPVTLSQESYSYVKDESEQLFFSAAAASAGRWAAISANPGDVIGPILSAHQAWDTWQGKVAGILEGLRPEPCYAGDVWHRRPWFTVDVRDVAHSQVCLMESAVESGSRFLLTDMTRIHPEDVGVRINQLYPRYEAATSVAHGTEEPLEAIDSVWDRVQTRNDRVRVAINMKFRKWDDTVRDMVESLISIGGVKPRLKTLAHL